MLQVKLLRNYYLGENCYYAGRYRKGELPESIENSEYVEIIGDIPEPESPDPNSSILSTEEIKLETIEPATKEKDYKTKPPVIAGGEFLDINRATIEQIISIVPKVSRAAATKIVESRDEKPFETIEDLKARFPNIEWNGDSLIF